MRRLSGARVAALGCALTAVVNATGSEIVLQDGSRLEVREAVLRGAWVHVEVDPATRWAYPVDEVDLHASGLSSARSSFPVDEIVPGSLAATGRNGWTRRCRRPPAGSASAPPPERQAVAGHGG